MKRMIAIIALSLLSFTALAEGANSPDPGVYPPAKAVPNTEEPSSTWRTVVTSLGVIGGVVIVDLFMGGSFTSSLFSWGADVVKGPIIYSPEVLDARAAGAVLGEMITPATNLRDVAARRDMFYALMLGIGGATGAVATSWWIKNNMDNDLDANNVTISK